MSNINEQIKLASAYLRECDTNKGGVFIVGRYSFNVIFNKLQGVRIETRNDSNIIVSINYYTKERWDAMIKERCI